MTGVFRTRLIAAVTAAAVGLGALATTASPAAALSDDGKQALGWVVGLGAAALLLNEIDKDKNHNTERQRYDNRYDNRYGDRYDNRYDNRYGDRYDDRHDRDDDRRGGRLTVPGSCLMQVRTRDGRREVVRGDCVQHSLGRVSLPRSCAFDLVTDRGRKERVYGRNCLEDRGFRIGRY